MTAGNAAIAANVTLKLNSEKEKNALWSGDAQTGYTVTTRDKLSTGFKSYLEIASGEDTTSTKSIPDGTDKTENADGSVTYTYTFAGIETGKSQDIKVTFAVANDDTKLAQDLKGAVEKINKAIADGTIKYQGTDLSQNAIETALAEKVKTAISTLAWGSTVKDDSIKVTLTDDWSNPGIGENGNKNCNFTIDFTLESNDVEKAADTMRVVINVENKTI